MKPVHEYAGYRTVDLTECKVHKIAQTDGSAHIVAFYPKTYVAVTAAQHLPVANGRMLPFISYQVTEWDQVLLAVIPAP